MESIEKNIIKDDRNQTTLATNNKRKQDDGINPSVSKVFLCESSSLPFGIANVLQSKSDSSKFSQTSVPSVHSWSMALNNLTASTSTAALANSLNWCAKCSAHFRLTSELVHHIRIHHSTPKNYHHHQLPTETPARKTMTNSTILICHICNEIFRERHHLTRHMTSHR